MKQYVIKLKYVESIDETHIWCEKDGKKFPDLLIRLRHGLDLKRCPSLYPHYLIKGKITKEQVERVVAEYANPEVIEVIEVPRMMNPLRPADVSKIQKIMAYYFEIKRGPDEKKFSEFASMDPDVLEMCQKIDWFINDKSIKL